jgi:hypothetical protein
MLTLARRYLALAALFFWQGGFTFYASVVVPLGQDILGSHLEQGFITQQVTRWLNVTGVFALLPLAWDVAGTRDSSRWRRFGRIALWAGMVLTLAGLFLLHDRLDRFLDPDEHTLLDRKSFRPLHRLYLWVQTIQWLAAVVYLLLTLVAWRAEDHHRAAARSRGAEEPSASGDGPPVGEMDPSARGKKCSAGDRLGVAQSPKQPPGGTASS